MMQLMQHYQWRPVQRGLAAALPRNLSAEQVVYNNLDINLVIPAKAGIQERHLENHPLLDSRLRGNDERKVMPHAKAGCRCASR